MGVRKLMLEHWVLPGGSARVFVQAAPKCDVKDRHFSRSRRAKYARGFYLLAFGPWWIHHSAALDVSSSADPRRSEGPLE